MHRAWTTEHEFFPRLSLKLPKNPGTSLSILESLSPHSNNSFYYQKMFWCLSSYDEWCDGSKTASKLGSISTHSELVVKHVSRQHDFLIEFSLTLLQTIKKTLQNWEMGNSQERSHFSNLLLSALDKLQLNNFASIPESNFHCASAK